VRKQQKSFASIHIRYKLNINMKQAQKNRILNSPELRDFIQSDERTSEIAQRHGISASTLTARAKRAGLPLRKRGRWRLAEPTAEQKAILELVRTHTYAEAGARVGVSKQRVSQVVRRWSQGEASPTRRSGVNCRQKTRVISFRVNDDVYRDLCQLLKHPWFKRLRSRGSAAREIVQKYLADVFQENRFSTSDRVVNHVKTSETI
jgi:hypothetical protein